MTEVNIFEILLKSHYDYPKLNTHATSTIAADFTDIIYDTLKSKSALPTSKRLNVIKFLKTIASTSENHVQVNSRNYLKFVEVCDKFNGGDLEDFIGGVSEELKETLPESLCLEVRGFYKRKNESHQRDIKRLELMKKWDQKALDEANFDAKIARSISYYETSDNIIVKLLTGTTSREKEKAVDISETVYRGKQIKFAYALLYLKQWPPLEKVLKRLSKYDTLISSEVNFLTYLNENLPIGGEHLRNVLVKDFFFVYEKALLDFCTEIISLDANQVTDFFSSKLLCDKNFAIISQLCTDLSFKVKVTHLVLELYSYSYCNPNLLKFLDFCV